ncbi:MAG TPA: phosphopantothenoylcysteine decarboxylase [Armatimonadetes bacterium]|nr:phosphopantothenoylcysteine decarboxylase [Armatimonadota bacterium]
MTRLGLRAILQPERRQRDRIAMNKHDLHGKRILISAGPTWVAIDEVRHIGNFATGRLGLELAREAHRRGAEVTLLLGPTRLHVPEADRQAIRVCDYTYFEELLEWVRREVGSRSYDAFLHTAAVSDYAPDRQSGKIASGREELVIRLHPLPKIVDEVKPLDPGILLVKFKLEVGVSREELIRIAQRSREHSRADLIVANDKRQLAEGAHPATILGPEGIVAEVEARPDLVRALLDAVAERLHPPEGESP